MKFRLHFFILSTFLLLYSHCWGIGLTTDEFEDAVENLMKVEESMDGKIYLQPSQVYITHNGILINFQDHVILVENLYSDINGVYFLYDEYKTTYDKDWECPRCNWVNNGDRKYCVKCNYHRR